MTWPRFYVGFVLLGVAPLAILTITGLTSAGSAARKQVSDYDVDVVTEIRSKASVAAKSESKYLTDLQGELSRPYDDVRFAELPVQASSELRGVAEVWNGAWRQMRAVLSKGSNPLTTDPAGVSGRELEFLQEKLKQLSADLLAAKAAGVDGIDRLNGFVQTRERQVLDYICIDQAKSAFLAGDYAASEQKLKERQWSVAKPQAAEELQRRAAFNRRARELDLIIDDLFTKPVGNSWEEPLAELNRFFTIEFPKSPDADDQLLYDELASDNARLKGSYQFSLLAPSRPLHERVQTAREIVVRYPNQKLRDEARDTCRRWLEAGIPERPISSDERLEEAITTKNVLLVGVFLKQAGGKWYKYWETPQEMINNEAGYQTVPAEDLSQQPTVLTPVGCVEVYNTKYRPALLRNIENKPYWEQFRNDCTALQKSLDEYVKMGGSASIEPFRNEANFAEEVLKNWESDILYLLAGWTRGEAIVE